MSNDGRFQTFVNLRGRRVAYALVLRRDLDWYTEPSDLLGAVVALKTDSGHLLRWRVDDVSKGNHGPITLSMFNLHEQTESSLPLWELGKAVEEGLLIVMPREGLRARPSPPCPLCGGCLSLKASPGLPVTNKATAAVV